MKKILKIVAALVIVLLVAYLVFLNIPQANVKSKSVMEEIGAEALYDAFTADEAAAETKYLGQVLEVSGVIDEKYEDESGSPVVVMSGSSGDAVAMITLEPSQKEILETYAEGSDIRIKAMCSGMLMEVTLTKGIIAK